MLRDDRLMFLNDVVRGRVSRRQVLARGAALGLAAPVVAELLDTVSAAAHRQEGTATTAHACSGAITWALETPPPNVLPYGGIATASWWGKEFMYDSLLEWDADLAIQPALAESYESPDELSYVFHLRQGVTFHDGTPLTANDVVYSLQQAVAPPPPGVVVPFLSNIAGVEAVDAATVRVTMSKIDPTLPGVLAWGVYTPIVPAGIYDRINPLSDGIGTGPFRLVEYVQDDRIVYTCNENYWKAGVPCIKDLTLKVLADEQSRVAALRSGEIDGGTFSSDVMLTLEQDDSIQALSGLFAAPRVIVFNMTREVPWRDTRVRQAINLVVDRQEIVDKVYGGDAELTGAISPGYGDWPLSDDALRQLYATDLERAKALMSEAGMAEGFDVTLLAISAPRDYVQIAEIVREQVKQLNINVTVEQLEIGTFAKNTSEGTFEWASTGRGMRGDPSGFVIDFRSGTAVYDNWFAGGWKNDELDTLYDEALTTLDPAVRLDLYRRIQEIIAADAPNLYTVQPLKYQAVTSRVSGMSVSYLGTNPGLRVACVTDE